MCIGSMGMEYGAGGSQMVTYISGGDETCMFGSSREMEALAEAIVVRRLIAFFFFQAEDGIRDGRVTGVQTCALPILAFGDNPNDVALRDGWYAFCEQIKEAGDHVFKDVSGASDGERTNAFRYLTQRSEERRVGKECRSRWWT